MDPCTSHIVIGEVGLKNSSIEGRQVLKVANIESLKEVFNVSLFEL